MGQERFAKWEPIDHLSKTMYVQGLHDDYEGFRVLLRGEHAEDPMLRISWDPAVTYRSIDESDRTRGAKISGLDDWSLFTVDDSEYIDWFDIVSDGPMDGDLVHYAISTPMDFVEVLSDTPPTVEWLNLEEHS